MKLRIKGNSIRLRLAKSELHILSEDGYIEEKTSFGKNNFSYTLKSEAGIEELSAEFVNNKITVFIPSAFIKEWGVNNVIGFEANFDTGAGESLHILVEKDFQCLNETDGNKEDKSDNFDNPNNVCL